MLSSSGTCRPSLRQHVHLVKRERHVAAQLPLQRIARAVEVLGSNELPDGRAEELFAGVAADALPGDVHRGDGTVEVVRADEVVGVLEELAVALFAAAQGFVGELALGDVLGDDQARAPSGGEEFERRDLHVDDGTVLGAVAELARAATAVEVVKRGASWPGSRPAAGCRRWSSAGIPRGVYP